MPKVFISYSRQDLTFVERLASDLQKNGIEIWWDRKDISPGSDWNKTIREGISTASSVIYKEHNITIYPFWIIGEKYTDCVPLGYGHIQYLDARDESYNKTLRTLVDLLRLSSTEEGVKLPETAPISRKISEIDVMNGLLRLAGKFIPKHLVHSYTDIKLPLFNHGSLNGYLPGTSIKTDIVLSSPEINYMIVVLNFEKDFKNNHHLFRYAIQHINDYTSNDEVKFWLLYGGTFLAPTFWDEVLIKWSILYSTYDDWQRILEIA